MARWRDPPPPPREALDALARRLAGPIPSGSDEEAVIQRAADLEPAWIALRMIRETLETLGPPGILPSEEAVLGLYGPEPVHEAEAIVEALRKLLARS